MAVSASTASVTEIEADAGSISECEENEVHSSEEQQITYGGPNDETLLRDILRVDDDISLESNDDDEHNDRDVIAAKALRIALYKELPVHVCAVCVQETNRRRLDRMG